ncbi:HD domain-containing protein, partial [Candidatus Woesearchaeota archaeon]|nr:HD domain-containing protein [Candidatus Woesearchaeota archaeon]
MTNQDISQKPAKKEGSSFDFSGFNGREEELQKITRYGMDRYTPMFYRTNVLLHSERVYFLLKNILPLIGSVYKSQLNSGKALTLALVHDDAEIISGDILLYHVERFSEEELARIREKEINAIEEISKKWPKTINSFNYKKLLYNALNIDTLEAQVVSFFDKTDAYCECLHEVHAGNDLFVNAVLAYVKRINDYPNKFPALREM